MDDFSDTLMMRYDNLGDIELEDLKRAVILGRQVLDRLPFLSKILPMLSKIVMNDLTIWIIWNPQSHSTAKSFLPVLLIIQTVYCPLNTSPPSSLACDAAAAAIEAGDLELAVELLEQGRMAIWSNLYGYKYPLDQFRQAPGGGELANRLEALSVDLLKLSTREKLADSHNASLLEAQTARQYRVLSAKWVDLVEKIREIEGFNDFLIQPSFKTLQVAAIEGPVILLNVSDDPSDALILLRENPPVLVDLPGVTPEGLQQQLNDNPAIHQVVNILRYLWHKIVAPVFGSLTSLGVPKDSRIWWCPTSMSRFMPLHAAGPYLSNYWNISEIYMCSYTPTLAPLIRARANLVRPVATPNILVVSNAAEKSDAINIKTESDVVQQHGGLVDVDVRVLRGAESTREAVLEGIKEHSWVHFACHSQVRNGSQFRDSFTLHNGSVNMLDLIQTRVLAQAEFAFVTERAFGCSLDFPDEHITLAAGLQFSGFRTVVGTFGHIVDAEKPFIMAEFYKYLFRNPGKIDFRDTVHALTATIQAMRLAGLPPQSWVMLAHFGA